MLLEPVWWDFAYAGAAAPAALASRFIFDGRIRYEPKIN